jgi:hypothetical protein
MMKRFKHVAAALVGIVAICGGGTAAQAASLIDFETAPIGISDNFNLSGVQFDTDFGYVTFGIDNNGDGLADAGKSAYLEAIGGTKSDTAGFLTDTRKQHDLDIDPNSDLGNYFLRTAGLGGDGGSLLITYDDGQGGGMTAAAQGELWDIDGNRSQGSEQWLVEALGVDYSVLESILSPEGTKNDASSLDGKAWTWGFNRNQNEIKAIRISFVGTKDAAGVGIAFDNFRADHVTNTADVPEPASLLSFLAVGGLFVGKRLKKRNA